MMWWLQEHVPEDELQKGLNLSEEELLDELRFEIVIAGSGKASAQGTDTGCVREEVGAEDEEAEAMRTAEKLVYGWPSKAADPTGARSIGRFVKAFPLEFPMGIGDLYEDRPRKVSPQVWVQHLLRYRTGQFVGGSRGQRVLWAMVNMLLLEEARGKGFGIYRNVVRRVGLGLEGGRVMTKGRLRDILRDESRARALVGQLSTVGRDVRSTTMQWAWEGKKLQTAVKHLSWIPPWVDAKDRDGNAPLGQCFVEEVEVEHERGKRDRKRGLVKDDVGLGRFPTLWWTQNPHYNAAFDIQRLDVSREALGHTRDSTRQGRFEFVRENADLVAQAMALRIELNMRIVMPSVVPHSEKYPYMAMARMETGSGGNPHAHGFSLGLPGPRVGRVHADLDGAGDVAPSSTLADMDVVRAWLWGKERGAEWWREQGDLSREMALRKLAEVLVAQEQDQPVAEGGDEDVDEAMRAVQVLAELVEEGHLEAISGERAAEMSDVKYRSVPPVPEADDRRARRGGRPDAVRHGARLQRAVQGVRDFGVLKPEIEHVDLQSRLEEEFGKFFHGVVSEWNPCYDDAGLCRYRWDEDVCAHDVTVEVGSPESSSRLPESSEGRARRLVHGAEPERLNLKSVLDEVYSRGHDFAGAVDVQPLRRLVAALVNRVARHTRHGMGPPKLNVHACARGKEGCSYCRYGFPKERLQRGGWRAMVMEKGQREGQWNARFPRNDRLCCSYEEHVLLGNMGNVDWRPVLNLWAVSEYVTKYAAKAPKGSRKIHEVLRDAVDEVCTFVPEGENADFLRRTIQKFFARVLGERDYHLYEAVPLGLQLPQVVPLMPVVSLNTTGSRPLKTHAVLKSEGEDAPVHYDSKVDKFNKRLAIVRKQRAAGNLSVDEAEVRDLSLFEFWWKFVVVKGVIRRAQTSVCIMVTPAYSADCANVAHAAHEGFARASVVAHWRHMPTSERYAMIEKQDPCRAVPRACWGGSVFETPPDIAGAPAEQRARFLGVRDLWAKFEATHSALAQDEFWALLLLEMITDPVLRQWVPAWLLELYERSNPFYKEVLTESQREENLSNRSLLKRVKRVMVKRHRRHVQKLADAKKAGGQGAAGDGAGSGSDGDGAGTAGDRRSESGAEEESDVEARRLAEGADEDPNEERAKMIRETQPGQGSVPGAPREDEGTDWGARSAAELLSAAGPAGAAADIEGGRESGVVLDGGVLLNPKGYDWLTQCPCNVGHAELHRLEKLRDEWFGKACVGDGADRVSPDELDGWQRFAHDIVMDERHKPATPLRLMLLGSAGTGKSRTIRSFVGSRRERKRRALSAPARTASRRLSAEEQEQAVRDCCLLAAPTGCASFQLKFGASTIHRAFGVPVGYCGPWSDAARQAPPGANTRYRRTRERLERVELAVVDELSMVGRAMAGKIEFKFRDTLRGHATARGTEDRMLCGRDAVLSGDARQAPPIGDEPLYREGEYAQRGQNKPPKADRTPSNAWTTAKLVRMGMELRNTFEDVVVLRQVHRYREFDPDLAPEKQKLLKEDAERFLDVTRGMAECTWTQQDHGWMSKRNRTRLQMSEEGRKELKQFDDAPLLMDGRVDRVTGEAGANKINMLKLFKMSADKQRPIAVLPAFHDYQEGHSGDPESIAADDFRGLENEIMVCQGARVLLTQNLWVEAGLMNGALGTVVGYMWPTGADPHHPTEKSLRAPIIVFVEFDDVNLGGDEHGVERTFFPECPERRRWIPIWRQGVACTSEEGMKRHNFPLTLAWALTHWKAQGMTLRRVRVHLSARTAAAAGIGFVACTRVRHPWDLVFEEDLPEYADFMKARKSRAFRERKRFDLRCLARASRTLRRYRFCDEDVWGGQEAADAVALLEGLRATASEQRERLSGAGKRVDNDTWLWGDTELDYAQQLAGEVARLAAGDAVRSTALSRVADRLLDRVRDRRLRHSEASDAQHLMGLSDSGELEEGIALLAGGDAGRLESLRKLAVAVARRVERVGEWDGVVEDGVPYDLQPLHFPAVQEALGALIPAKLHGSLDKAAANQRDDFGNELRGGSFVHMGDWRISVRAEDRLHHGRLDVDLLEFFVLVLQQVCGELQLPVAVGSTQVGKYVGRTENAEAFGRIMAKWKRVWDWQAVRNKEELVIVAAVDEKLQDWVLVRVRSSVRGQHLGAAKRLHVCVHDSYERESVRERIAQNVDVLLRGVEGRVRGAAAKSEFALPAPKCKVSSQRIMGAFGALLAHVSVIAGEKALDVGSETFVPNVGVCLRAVFVNLRTELDGMGKRDAALALKDADACRKVLRGFMTVPTLSRRAEAGVQERVGGDSKVAALVKAAEASSKVSQRAEVAARLRVATWNIAGGLRSAQAPKEYSQSDQRAVILAEILRWRRAFGVDIVCLQECEAQEAMSGLLAAYEFVGSQPAPESRGFVHMYARKGLEFERLVLPGKVPGVAAIVGAGQGETDSMPSCVVGLHLPAGEKVGGRLSLVKQALQACEKEASGRCVVVGDFNASDEEVADLCKTCGVSESVYKGFSWGVRWNKFFSHSKYRGVGTKYDRVLFAQECFAAAHLIAQGRIGVGGEEFCMSDHFGLLVFADMGRVFSSRAKADQGAARTRRRAIAEACEQSQQAEYAEVQARRQALREDRALARQLAVERDREGMSKAQRRGAQARQRRRADLQSQAFGSASLFRGDVVAQPVRGEGAVVSPASVAIHGWDGVPAGSWSSVAGLPRIGFENRSNMCYANSALQVLLRTPAVAEFAKWHTPERCGIGGRPDVCIGCCLHQSFVEVSSIRPAAGALKPSLVRHRRLAGGDYDNDGQQDASDFVRHVLEQLVEVERRAGREAPWAVGELEWPDYGQPRVTQVERLFGFVVEMRRCCEECGLCKYSLAPLLTLALPAVERDGGPMTISELYLAECGPRVLDGESAVACARCQRRCKHREQMRVVQAPNVLVVQIKRQLNFEEGRIVRHDVSLEEHLELAGFPRMALCGVVSHVGPTPQSGHYTAMCRNGAGHMWIYDDDRVAELHMDVGHWKGRNVALAVYCRQDGSAEASGSERGGPEVSGSGGGGIGRWCIGGSAGAASSSDGARGGEVGGLRRGLPVGVAESGAKRARFDEGSKGQAAVENVVGRSQHHRGEAASSSSGGRGRIVSGFGEEREGDVRAASARRDREQLLRARERDREGTRGDMVGFDGQQLSRSAGGAWYLGKK